MITASSRSSESCCALGLACRRHWFSWQGSLTCGRTTGCELTITSFAGETAALTSISGVLRGAAAFDSLALMQLGLLVLIATPVARVLFAAFAFALERDWMYVVVSLIVFAVLMATLTGVAV